MPDPTFEARLASQLQAYAQGGVRPIDRYALAEATIAAGARRGPAIPRLWPERPSLVPVLLGLLLLLAVAAAAIGVGSFLLRAPSPSATRSGYDGLIVRPVSDAPLADLDVIAVKADGTERVLRRLTSSDLPDSWSFTGGAKASRDGWIAMLVDGPPDPQGQGAYPLHAYALFDLADPARPARMVPTTEQGAWGGDHLFAVSVANFDVIEVVDAETGARTKVGGLNLPGGGPDIVWTEDGSGIVWQRLSGQLAIRPIDGGPPSPIPALAFPRGSRFIAAGGARLESEAGKTTDPVDPERPAEAIPPGTVRVLDATGVPTNWYGGELEPARLLDASFAADGRSLWLLLERMDGTHHVADVARMDAPGEARVVASVDLGQSVALLWFEGFAPDDSAIAIGHWTGTLGNESTTGDATPGPLKILWMSEPRTGSHPGALAGFVPAAVSDGIPTP